MKGTLIALLLFVGLGATSSYAKCEYNDPGSEALYTKCVTNYKKDKNYKDGNSKSKKCGLTKVEAFCRCAWNEEPGNGKVKDLHKWLESDAAGKKVSTDCAKWSGWE